MLSAERHRFLYAARREMGEAIMAEGYRFGSVILALAAAFAGAAAPAAAAAARFSPWNNGTTARAANPGPADRP